MKRLGLYLVFTVVAVLLLSTPKIGFTKNSDSINSSQSNPTPVPTATPVPSTNASPTPSPTPAPSASQQTPSPSSSSVPGASSSSTIASPKPDHNAKDNKDQQPAKNNSDPHSSEHQNNPAAVLAANTDNPSPEPSSGPVAEVAKTLPDPIAKVIYPSLDFVARNLRSGFYQYGNIPQTTANILYIIAAISIFSGVTILASNRLQSAKYSRNLGLFNR